jgi:hypothetical protein
MSDTKIDATWKNTLTCYTFVGNINELLRPARKLGYKYIVWNGRVYLVNEDKWEDTGIFESDLI